MLYLKIFLWDSGQYTDGFDGHMLTACCLLLQHRSWYGMDRERTEFCFIRSANVRKLRKKISSVFLRKTSVAYFQLKNWFKRSKIIYEGTGINFPKIPIPWWGEEGRDKNKVGEESVKVKVERVRIFILSIEDYDDPGVEESDKDKFWNDEPKRYDG